ncbi:nucleotidyltransferase family protein [Virgibacillus sp. JSM 102003]|uniref:nucleotidyltransferase family protein n=1 Tax=Virgibacillus sp. JSM 102003 TaxID=1562108 RepID=UPI0035C120C3
MKMNRTEDIIQVIQADKWMMDILKAAQQLQLPDWWICAGFVRSKVWDVLHGFDERTVLPDIDVVYFDEGTIDEAEEKRLEKILHKLLPEVPWSVKNEARMHVRNNLDPYSSTEDAIAKFPETATALGVKLSQDDDLILTAPHGVDDVLNMVVRPTPYFAKSAELLKIYKQRVVEKDWSDRWNMVKVEF